MTLGFGLRIYGVSIIITMIGYFGNYHVHILKDVLNAEERGEICHILRWKIEGL